MSSLHFNVYFILFLLDVLGGYNGTIFAYGQTSSGKTHTMEASTDKFTCIYNYTCIYLLFP